MRERWSDPGDYSSCAARVGQRRGDECLHSGPTQVPGPGHKRPVPPHAKFLPGSPPEGQVYGDESGPLVGPTRPLAVDSRCQLSSNRSRSLPSPFGAGSV